MLLFMHGEGNGWGLRHGEGAGRQAKVSAGYSVTVSSFDPPDDFKLALLTLELAYVRVKYNQNEVDAVLLAQQLRKRFLGQVMTTGQKVAFELYGTNYVFTVNQALLEGQESSTPLDRGFLSSDTYIIFEAAPNSGIKVINQKEAASSKLFKHKEFNLEKLGIGGLSAEFTDIFRRAFASRVFPPHVVSRLGIKHVKGILLYGPPGTGKTLMARQIGKLLNGKEPKIVNGPEVLSKFVGETEKNVRDLFADAENEQTRTRGDQCDLHVIIFDEIDAICKLHVLDDYIGKSKKILVAMSKRMDRNKWIVWGIIATLVLAILFILYFKLASPENLRYSKCTSTIGVPSIHFVNYLELLLYVSCLMSSFSNLNSNMLWMSNLYM